MDISVDLKVLHSQAFEKYVEYLAGERDVGRLTDPQIVFLLNQFESLQMEGTSGWKGRLACFYVREMLSPRVTLLLRGEIHNGH